jgi:hypothetical protein
MPYTPPPYAPVVAKTSYGTDFSTTSTTDVDITGLSVSITLTKTSNVLVYVRVRYVYNNTAGYNVYTRLLRGTTVLQYAICGNPSAYNKIPLHLQTLDKDVPPGTYTYKAQGSVDGGTGYWIMATIPASGEIVAIAF